MRARKLIPANIVAEVKIRSLNRCPLCFGLRKDFSEKRGQIAHIDHDPSNSSISNLVFLCLEDHDIYDSRTSQSKGIPPQEMIHYRDQLYEYVSMWRNEQISHTPRIERGIEKSFDSGSRIQMVRNDLGVSPSQFIEIIDLKSEKYILSIENQEIESPVSILETIQDETGARLEWLKHGIEPRYETNYLPFTRPKEAVSILHEVAQEDVYVTIQPKSLHVGILAELKPYRYKVYHFGLYLDYWNWIDQLNALPMFYRFLEEVVDAFFPIYGLVLPKKHDEALYKGKIHAMSAIRAGDLKRPNWPADILDYEQEGKSTINIRDLYDPWFFKVQNCFREVMTNYSGK